MEKLIVDRIVGDVVVLEKEDKSHIEIKTSDIAFMVREGSVLFFDGVSFTHDADGEAERRRKIHAMQEKLKNRKN